MNKILLPYNWEDYLLLQIEQGIPEQDAINNTVHFYHKGEQMGRRGLGNTLIASRNIVKRSWFKQEAFHQINRGYYDTE
jgi:hypothetical protein